MDMGMAWDMGGNRAWVLGAIVDDEADWVEMERAMRLGSGAGLEGVGLRGGRGRGVWLCGVCGCGGGGRGFACGGYKSGTWGGLQFGV